MDGRRAWLLRDEDRLAFEDGRRAWGLRMGGDLGF